MLMSTTQVSEDLLGQNDTLTQENAEYLILRFKYMSKMPLTKMSWADEAEQAAEFTEPKRTTKQHAYKEPMGPVAVNVQNSFAVLKQEVAPSLSKGTQTADVAPVEETSAAMVQAGSACAAPEHSFSEFPELQIPSSDKLPRGRSRLAAASQHLPEHDQKEVEPKKKRAPRTVKAKTASVPSAENTAEL